MTEEYEIPIDGEIDENNTYWLEQTSVYSNILPPPSSSLAFRSMPQHYNQINKTSQNDHHIVPITEEDEDSPSEHEIQIITDDMTSTNIGESDIMQNYISAKIEFEQVKEKKFKPKKYFTMPTYQVYPPHVTLVHWIRENCVNPFVDSFYQQIRADALQIGVSIIPLLPIWNYLTFGLYKVSKPCQELPIEYFTTPKNVPKKPLWKKLYSMEGFFLIALSLCVITQLSDRDDEVMKPKKKPPSHRQQKYVGI